MSRLEDLQRFYEILDKLEQKIGRTRSLADPNWRKDLPERGVYFFFEPGEERSHTDEGPRVVRVGIGPKKDSAKVATLSTRLGKHKGNKGDEGGHHRSSVFRREIGEALMERDDIECPTWKIRGTAPRSVRESEVALEQGVSKVIRQMPFLWVSVDGWSKREYIEKNATALLSNFDKSPLDLPSDTWLGRWSTRRKVRESGQWNSDYVDAIHDPKFLDVLESAVKEMEV